MARKPQEKFASDRLKEALSRAGLKKSELALKVGVDPAQVTRWAAEKTGPDGEDAKRVALALGVSLDFLYKRDASSSRMRLVQEASVELGPPEAKILAAMDGLTADRRRDLAERVLGWIDHETEKPFTAVMEPPQMDAVPHRLPGRGNRARANVGSSEQADEDPAGENSENAQPYKRRPQPRPQNLKRSR